MSVGVGLIFAAFAVLFGMATITQRQQEAEVTSVLRELRAGAQQRTAEEFVDYIEKRKGDYPSLVILLAQRSKVTTLLGKEQIQTRWRAGSLRIAEWPVVKPEAVAGAADGAVSSPASDWFTMTAYKGSQDPIHEAVRLRARYAYFAEKDDDQFSQPGLLLIVGRDEKAGKEILKPLSNTAIALAVIVPIFVAFSAYLSARFVVGKIDEIAETSTEIIGGDLSRRVLIGDKNDEFGRLSVTLNRMLDQIQRLLIGMKEVSDNIAHDLKTPLYRLRSRIELALVDVDAKESPTGPRDALEVALKEAERLLATFNALLSIARMEAGVVRENVQREDVADILQDVSELYEPVAEDRGLHLKTSAPRGQFVRCNRELVVQALSNLVDNALKYSPENTTVSLSARNVQPTRGTGRGVEIAISDQGPGIRSEDRARVLKRFVRLDVGRGAPGSGLGLSLVSAIAQLHDAVLTLDDGPQGTGLTVRLVFPAA